MEEKHEADHLGKIFSCKGEYLSWMFQCYYKESLEEFLGRLNQIPNFDLGGGTMSKSFQKKEMQGIVEYELPIVIWSLFS